jgi:hypothetical protein
LARLRAQQPETMSTCSNKNRPVATPLRLTRFIRRVEASGIYLSLEN